MQLQLLYLRELLVGTRSSICNQPVVGSHLGADYHAAVATQIGRFRLCVATAAELRGGMAPVSTLNREGT